MAASILLTTYFARSHLLNTSNDRYWNSILWDFTIFQNLNLLCNHFEQTGHLFRDKQVNHRRNTFQPSFQGTVTRPGPLGNSIKRSLDLLNFFLIFQSTFFLSLLCFYFTRVLLSFRLMHNQSLTKKRSSVLIVLFWVASSSSVLSFEWVNWSNKS